MPRRRQDPAGATARVMVVALALSAPVSAAASVQGSARTEPTVRRPDVTLDVSLQVNDRIRGEIVAEIGATDVRIPLPRLLELLGGDVDADLRARLAAAATEPEALAAVSSLRALGLDIVYDPAGLALVVRLEAGTGAAQRLSLREDIAFDPKNAIPPSRFSGGINLIARPAWIHAGGKTGLEPFRAELRGFLNYGGFEGWNLLYAFDFTEGQRRSIERRDVLLVKDDYESATRFQLGDFRTQPASSLGRSIDILGVGLSRDYVAINPFRTLTPRGRTFFTLERPARVRVEVQGGVVLDRMLEPGSYDVRDFPFVTGANTARVTVDEGLGPREIAFLSTYLDLSLLDPGLTLFDVAAGVRSNGFSADRRYANKPVASGYVRRGITDRLTLGAHAELSGDAGQAGASAAFGTPIGLIAGEIGASYADNRPIGLAGAAQYRVDFARGGWFHDITAQARYQSAGFSGIAGTFGRETSFDARYNLRRDDWSVNAAFAFQDTAADRRRTGTIGANWRIWSLSVNASVERRWSDRERTQTRGVLSVSRALGHRQQVRARGETNGDWQLEYRRFTDLSVGAVRGRAQLTNARGVRGIDAEIGYIANRGEISIDHATREAAGGGTFSRTSATIGIGAGFASDGAGKTAVQFGRPFDTGFMIVDRHRTLGGRKLRVDEAFGRAGHTDMFGAAFIPLRGSYRAQDLAVGVDDLPPGYDIGEARLRIYPGFRAGYHRTIGSDAANTVVGRLSGEDGAPVPLAVGRLVAAGAPSDAAIAYAFFTNRTGRMVVEGVPPGNYDVLLGPRRRRIGAVAIAADAAGLVDIGSIVVRREDLP